MGKINNYGENTICLLELLTSITYDFQSQKIIKQSQNIYGILINHEKERDSFYIKVSGVYLSNFPDLSFISLRGELLKIISKSKDMKNYITLFCKKHGYKI